MIYLSLFLLAPHPAQEHSLQPYADCNGNGVEDAVDIGTGTSTDGNMNGVPDECEEFEGLW